MKNIFKRLFISVICVTLATALMAVGVLADSSSSQSKRPDRQKGPGTQQGGPDGGRSKQDAIGSDAFLAKIKEKIEALENEEQQAALTKLLEAYEDALAAEKAALEAAASTTQDTLEPLRKATADARSALASALSDAGIDIMNRGGNVDDQNSRSKAEGGRKERDGFAFQTLDVEVIEKLIAALDDDDTQADLTKLLKTYTDALEAEKAGINDSSLTDDAKKALHETLTAAADSLTEALADAGIEQSEYTRRPGHADDSVSGQPDASSASDGANGSSGSAKTGFLQSLINWLGSWMK